MNNSMETEIARAMEAAELLRSDPVRSMTKLPLRALYFPLGFPLEIQTNSPAVLAAAKQSWGLFQPEFSYPPLTLRLGVTENSTDSSNEPPAPVCRSQGNLYRTSLTLITSSSQISMRAFHSAGLHNRRPRLLFILGTISSKRQLSP